MNLEYSNHLVHSVLSTLILNAILVFARRGVPNPNFSLRPPLLHDKGQIHYKTTYACEGNPLHLHCEEGRHIHLDRANYGRFSISICNDGGRLDWSVNCMSYRSFLIMQDRCSQKSNCSVLVSSKMFGDPCPGTLKYLEVQYHCAHRRSSTTTRRPPTALQINIPPMLPPKSNPNNTIYFAGEDPTKILPAILSINEDVNTNGVNERQTSTNTNEAVGKPADGKEPFALSGGSSTSSTTTSTTSSTTTSTTSTTTTVASTSAGSEEASSSSSGDVHLYFDMSNNSPDNADNDGPNRSGESNADTQPLQTVKPFEILPNTSDWSRLITIVVCIAVAVCVAFAIIVLYVVKRGKSVFNSPQSLHRTHHSHIQSNLPNPTPLFSDNLSNPTKLRRTDITAMNASEKGFAYPEPPYSEIGHQSENHVYETVIITSPAYNHYSGNNNSNYGNYKADVCPVRDQIAFPIKGYGAYRTLQPIS